MSKKRMLADVLWEAANKWLHPEVSAGWAFENAEGLCAYSCHAIQAAIEQKVPTEVHNLENDVMSFVEELGCNNSLMDRKTRRHIQGVRYMWLLLAMHVAEDEGIEV